MLKLCRWLVPGMDIAQINSSGSSKAGQDAYRSRQIGLVQQAVQSNRVFKITVCGITHPNMGVTMFHRSLHDVLQAVQLTQMIQDGSRTGMADRWIPLIVAAICRQESPAPHSSSPTMPSR